MRSPPTSSMWWASLPKVTGLPSSAATAEASAFSRSVQIAFATSTAALFITLLTLGVGRFLIKEIARNHAVISTYLGSAIALRAIMSLVVLAAIIIISQFVTDSEISRRVMWIAAATIVVNSFMGLGNSVLNGLENLKWPATVEVLSKVIVVVAGVTVLVQGFANLGARRAGQVAVWRAVGARRRDVAQVLMFEALACAVAGAVPGVLAAVAAVAGLHDLGVKHRPLLDAAGAVDDVGQPLLRGTGV